jgi:diguanylate cyclase (GGDEF)-like protein/PAS domain S-box-containing protein
MKGDITHSRRKGAESGTHLAHFIDELELHRKYIKTLEITAGLLLEKSDEETWTEVLRLISATSDSHCAALFLNKVDDSGRLFAKLSSTWSQSEAASQLTDFAQLREISYEDFPLLSDTLHVGMVLAKKVTELPPQEFLLFGRQNIKSVLCIPLLVAGEMEGFIGLFHQKPGREWLPLEINVLCAVANSMALALARERVEQRLKASATRLRALVGATEDIVVEFDQKGQILNCWADNPSRSFGIDPDTSQGIALNKALPREMAQAISLSIPRILASGSRETFEFMLSVEGEDRYFLGRLQVLPSETGQTRSIVALIRDVTDLMQEEARRVAMLETLNLLEEAIIDLSLDGKLLNASAAWNKLLEDENGSDVTHLGRKLQEYVHPDDQATLEAALAELAGGTEHSKIVRFRLNQQDGEYIWVEARLLAHHSPGLQTVSLRGILRDITSSYLQERRITQLALHDSLTQLPNRILLEDHLTQAIARAQRNNTKVALGFIDLDHFKHINDTLGHKAGDTVLVTLSRRLQAVLREIDTLSRWGGDEFVVLLPDANSEEDIRRIAERLRDAARESVDLDGIETKLTISLGFAVYPDDADSAETLMSVADHTMFHAKGVGRNNVQFFQDIHDKKLDRENMLLQTRLAHSIQNRELQIFYQPVVDAHSGQVMAFEALARWQDEQHGWVSPSIFIPMAEHLGVIHELGEQVFDHTLQRLATWRQADMPVKASVNISRTQLFAPAFVHSLVEKVAAHKLTPQDLILEITESVALLDLSYESKRLQELSDAGFAIAIDDFGTGYSALSQLHQMPVNILKIDSSFTSRLDSEEGRRIVQAIVQMADALNLKMVVEGVEDAETVDYLLGIGVRHMQGIHFSEAVPAGVCEMLMQQSPSLFSGSYSE